MSVDVNGGCRVGSSFETMYANMKLVGRDKLDEITVCSFFYSRLMHLPLQGVRHKFGAFEPLLEKYLMW